MTNDPSEVWGGEFGESWTIRHPTSVEALDRSYQEQYGIPRTALNELFLGSLDREARILEVGANVGTQLAALSKMGFENLHGVEILDYAIEEAREAPHDVLVQYGEAGHLPFTDGAFDLVFTSGVLIHVPEERIESTLREIARCSRRFVWGFEYFADERVEVEYRGHESLLWKDDFAARYVENCPLELRKQILVTYLTEPVRDAMFLLERT